MKNKKIIALICALSMIISMFSMITASADGETSTPGLTLSGSLSDDGTKVTVNVTLTGVDDSKVKSAQINVNVPDGVTSKDQISAVCEGNADVKYKPNLDGTTVKMNFADSDGFEIANNKLATITFDLGTTPLAADYTAALQDGTAVISVNNGPAKLGTNMEASSTTIAKWKDPNAKSDAEKRPDKQEESGGETPKDVTTDKLGLNLTGEVSADNKTVTVNVALSEVADNKVKSAQININAPTGVTSKDQISAVCEGNADVKYKPNLDGTTVKMNFADSDGFEIADGKLAKITFDLGDNALADTYVAALQEGTAIITVNYGPAKLGTNMDATQAVINPAEADKGTATTVDLEDYMGKDKTTGDDAATVAKAAEAAGKTIYITVDVTKEDENGNQVPATYGTDYEAVFDGKTLTEAEYNNLIHGYTETPISEVIEGLQFKVYDTAKNAKIKTSLNATDSDTQLVNDQEKTDVASNDTPGGKTPTDKKPAISVKASTTQVTAGEGTVVKVYVDKITNPNTDGTLTVSVSEGALDLVTGTGIRFIDSDTEDDLIIDKEEKAFEIKTGSEKDKYIKFVGASKGTITFTFNYTATGDVTGTEVKAQAQEKKITIKAPASNGGGGSSSDSNKSSGGGAIASGLVDVGTGTYLGKFSDLDQAPWATEAINSLASKNIVNGRGDGTFDPNANITRAEYAQILINAIGKQSESADTYFNDVPTDAWFYHNVAVAAQYGIVSGYGDGNFGPYDLITREQMALMTLKAAQVMSVNLTGANVGTFADDAQIADWSRDAVYTLANAGIVNGMGDGTFAPKANATRAQASVIIYNTFIK